MSPLLAGRLKMSLIASLFIAPMAAAWILYLHPEWRPAARVNYGELIEPPRASTPLALEAAEGPAPGALRGKWTLAYVAGRDCDAACVDRLVLARQVRTLLNQNRGRVQRVYIAPDPPAREAARAQLAAEHPDLVFLADAGAPGARATDFFTPGEAADPHALQLLDPLGVWLMRYAGAVDYKGVLKDIKKLLRFSTIG